MKLLFLVSLLLFAGVLLSGCVSKSNDSAPSATVSPTVSPEEQPPAPPEIVEATAAPSGNQPPAPPA